MELTLTGDLARQILSASKNDSKMAQALAKQYLSAIEPQAMAAYLLSEEVAIALLADRLQKHPVATIRALQRLPERGGPAPRKARKAAARPRRGGKRRSRMTPEQVDRLKSQVTDFLAKNGWTTRKELTATVALETQAVYRRIMGELQQEGRIVSKGQKSKAVYAVKDGKKTKKAGGRKRKKAARKKPTKPKKA